MNFGKTLQTLSGRRPWIFGLAGGLWGSVLTAQGGAPEFEQPENMLLRWAGVLLVLVLIWFILYKVVYPFFLHYYRDDFCKTVFWNLFMLYGLTWVFLSSYIVLEFGFFYSWMQWIAAFLAVLWLISGLVILLRRPAA